MNVMTVLDINRLGQVLSDESFSKDRDSKFAQHYDVLFDILKVDASRALFGFSGMSANLTGADLKMAGINITDKTLCLVCSLTDDTAHKPHDFYFWEEFINKLKVDDYYSVKDTLNDEINDYATGDFVKFEQVVYDHTLVKKVDVRRCWSFDDYMMLATEYGIIREDASTNE